MRRITTFVCVALLLLPLVLPQGLDLLGVSEGAKAQENRLKTPLPPLSLAFSDFKAFSKQLTAPGFQLKGSGWYATDFKNSGSKPAASTSSSSDSAAAPAAAAPAPANS